MKSLYTPPGEPMQARVRLHGDGPAAANSANDLVACYGIEISDRGEAELKGVSGMWRLYSVASPVAVG
jgi:hypothetical protein